MYCSRIPTMVDDMWRDAPTGTLLTVALEDLQLKMGSTSPFSEEPFFRPCRWMTTESWIKSYVTFIWDNDITIQDLGCTIWSTRLFDED